MKTNKSDFRAPIKPLQSSWVTLAYSKPKKGAIVVKRSLGSSRQVPLIKSMGQFVVGNFSDTSY